MCSGASRRRLSDRTLTSGLSDLAKGAAGKANRTEARAQFAADLSSLKLRWKRAAPSVSAKVVTSIVQLRRRSWKSIRVYWNGFGQSGREGI